MALSSVALCRRSLRHTECAPLQWSSVAVLYAVTWNIAAINNNPFEYWITHNDKDYNALMEAVQHFIDDPKSRDVPVSQVFSQSMWMELKELMIERGWDGIEQTDKLWRTDFSSRKIISEFMQDKTLGDKRLASMPDRYTNTINTVVCTQWFISEVA
ncbi:hypothetical protein AB1Y20_021934 [Prymnesium parvum]|uniref:Uncharacterized protein n=1 Tax=Prymnesium parvum TaxID=97485 RepID=A0AB34JI56_PRYPA